MADQGKLRNLTDFNSKASVDNDQQRDGEGNRRGKTIFIVLVSS
jgi:hypothetical protein